MGWDIVAVFAIGVLLGTLIGFFLCLRFAYKLFSKIAQAVADADAKKQKTSSSESADGFVYYYTGSDTGSGGPDDSH